MRILFDAAAFTRICFAASAETIVGQAYGDLILREAGRAGFNVDYVRIEAKGTRGH
jgi:hypothetical protein